MLRWSVCLSLGSGWACSAPALFSYHLAWRILAVGSGAQKHEFRNVPWSRCLTPACWRCPAAPALWYWESFHKDLCSWLEEDWRGQTQRGRLWPTRSNMPLARLVIFVFPMTKTLLWERAAEKRGQKYLHIHLWVGRCPEKLRRAVLPSRGGIIPHLAD